MIELTRQLAAAEHRRRTSPRASQAYDKAVREADAIRRRIWLFRYDSVTRQGA